MIKFIKQLFCKHYYKYDKIDVVDPINGVKIMHKTCKYCGKSKNTIKIL